MRSFAIAVPRAPRARAKVVVLAMVFAGGAIHSRGPPSRSSRRDHLYSTLAAVYGSS